MNVPALRSPLKWIGGKYASASRIVAAFPSPHSYTTYLEPCGGAAHVLMQKPNWGHREIYNDLNDDLVNFWLQVRDHADGLVASLSTLPYSRKLYYDAHRRLFDGSERDPLERAALFFYVLRGTGTGWLRAAPVGWNNTTSSAAAYRSVLDLFTLVQERLTQPKVIIENRDVLRVLEEYDSPTTLHYVDPPYIGAEYYYQAGIRKHPKQRFDHERLAERLNMLQGYVALSYYPHADLDVWYPAPRWRRLVWHQHKPSTLAGAVGEEMREATEVLLCNYPLPVQSLWSESLEEGGV
ncbi:DNA methyltransferase [Reticulibacter mediterranei]|uniref:site-specific DNA-methyltransferase (adenine-specific) n=1 Tax=Reticulibacter mediterranei TaxID=2778369 RepID=A0A8J3N559_9CHLR|nr:DNA adenine methylase [Reticulibacter mediterranei]GHO94817.1 DNA methyltransferase [Reticulibacter mediterranei]